MRTLILLVALAAINGCATGQLPPKPQGTFCTHNRSRDIAICDDLRSLAPQPDISVSDTDKWIMLSPDTWESIQNYIDALKQRIQK